MNGTNGFFEHTLSNGLRVVIEPMPHVQSVAAGYIVRTGSRDETAQLAGVSHFLEHMCFKGTAKRTWREITIDFDNLGSTYNAYTSKERTVYFGWVRVPDLEKQLELLTDMMQSAIPPNEFETEKKVVLEEIARSDDQIDHSLYDVIHESLFAGHPLAWPVLGTQQSIGRMTRDELFGYCQSRYHPANMILAVAGAIEPRAVIGMAERICGGWPARSARPQRGLPPAFTQGQAVRQVDRFQQQALVLTFPAPSAVHADRETADVFASVLGGHNSRFFWNIVQAGIAPQVGAGRLDYCDTGLMMAWGFCDPPKAEPLLEAMRTEIAKISREGATEEEVQRVKNRTRTGLTTEAESPYYRLMQVFQDLDDLDRPRSATERLAAVEAVTPAKIRDYIATWPMTGTGHLTSLGPRAWPAA